MPSPRRGIASITGRWWVALALLGSGLATAEEIVLASPDYWCPFTCQAGAAQEGFTVEIIRRIFAPHGISVRLHNENYSRALRHVREGRYTATASTFKDEAPDFIFPGLPVSFNRFCFYTRSEDRWDYTGPASLAGRQLGVVQDYAYGSEIDGFIQANPRQVQRLSGDQVTARLIKLLRRQRLDTFVEEQNLVRYTLRQQSQLPLREAGCETTKYAYMAISPNHPRAAEYAQMFNRGMRQLRASGELEQLLRSYGLRDWQR